MRISVEALAGFAQSGSARLRGLRRRRRIRAALVDATACEESLPTAWPKPPPLLGRCPGHTPPLMFGRTRSATVAIKAVKGAGVDLQLDAVSTPLPARRQLLAGLGWGHVVGAAEQHQQRAHVLLARARRCSRGRRAPRPPAAAGWATSVSPSPSAPCWRHCSSPARAMRSVYVWPGAYRPGLPAHRAAGRPRRRCGRH